MIAFRAEAQDSGTTTIAVPSTAEPWSTTENPNYNFGINDGGAPAVVVLPTGDAAMSSVTIQYESGLVSAGPVWPFDDAKGDLAQPVTATSGSTGTGFPSAYINNATAYLAELVGVFATAKGVIVGQPFVVPDQATVPIPAGATQLQLGINDDRFGDNLGSFSVDVDVPPQQCSTGDASILLDGQGSVGPEKFNVYAGQPINLSLQTNDGSSSDGDWQAPGSSGLWSPQPTNSTPPSMPSEAVLASSSPTFYYTHPDTFTVTHSYFDPAGNKCSVSTDVLVTEPTITQVSAPGQAGIAVFTHRYKNPIDALTDAFRQNVLACGMQIPSALNPPGTGGQLTNDAGQIVGTENAILFNVQNPNQLRNASQGGFQWVQVLNEIDRFGYEADGQQVPTKPVVNALDSDCPYTTGPKYNNTLYTPYTGDSPQSLLGSSVASKIDEALYFNATMYLLWRSRVAGSMPVPLGSTTWVCVANAQRAATFLPWFQEFFDTTEPFKPSAEYPRWTSFPEYQRQPSNCDGLMPTQ